MQADRTTARGGRPRGRKAGAIGLAVALIAGLGWLFSSLPPLYNVPRPAQEASPADAATAVRASGADSTPAAAEDRSELKRRFDEAVLMLHARRYEYAVAALHRVLELSPRLPEAHVNMGYALLGLERYDAARDFFLSAIGLRPGQANAYYGLAEAYEGLGSLPEALGSMRTYLHLARPDSPYRTRARSALWEWEAQLQPRPRPDAGSATESEAP